MEYPKESDWSLGANNMADPDRLPENFVRDAINMDARDDGKLTLRNGARKIYEGVDIRFAASINGALLFIENDEVFVLEKGIPRLIGQVNASGRITGVEHQGILYISTVAETLCFDGRELYPWGMYPPAFSIVDEPGSLPAGIYKVAVTRMSDRGEESGGEVKIIKLPEGRQIRVYTEQSGDRVYVSAVDSQTLYYQGDSAASYAVTRVFDDGERLTTANDSAPPMAAILASVGAVILMARGRYLWMTKPYSPHLCDAQDVIQFPQEITNVVSAGLGVYITADKTYFISGIGTTEHRQRVVVNRGAVAFTGITLPDDRATWFTEEGQVFGTPDGAVTFPNEDNYLPNRAQAGASGFIEVDGVRTVVTSLNRGVTKNAAAIGDHCDVEVVPR
jgi:hypothetical protein